MGKNCRKPPEVNNQNMTQEGRYILIYSCGFITSQIFADTPPLRDVLREEEEIKRTVWICLYKSLTKAAGTAGKIFSFSHLSAAVACAVVLSVRLASRLSAVSISQIFFFDVQTDVLLFFHWNRSFETLYSFSSLFFFFLFLNRRLLQLSTSHTGSVWILQNRRILWLYGSFLCLKCQEKLISSFRKYLMILQHHVFQSWKLKVETRWSITCCGIKHTGGQKGAGSTARQSVSSILSLTVQLALHLHLHLRHHLRCQVRLRGRRHRRGRVYDVLGWGGHGGRHGCHRDHSSSQCNTWCRIDGS